MAYVATVNVPGYLPMDDDPPVFDTASAAWEYLAGERRRDEDAVEYPSDTVEAYEYSETVRELTDAAARTDILIGEDGTGTVYGDTPGYDGDHDLGLAYCVTLTEDVDASE